MRIFLILALPLLLIGRSSSAEVKTHMDEMLGYIFDLKPFITSTAEFTAPDNGPIISETLGKMIVLSEKIKHEDRIKKTASQVPAMALNQQLKQAQEIFNSGNKSYALWLVRSNLSNCVACHTQLPAQSTHFASGGKKKYLVNTFQEAEFLYIIRNFDKALELYNRTISEFPKNKVSPQDLDTAIFRKIFYFTRVKRDLNGLSVSLNKDVKNKNLLPATQYLLKSYSKAAKEIAKETTPSFPTDKELKIYAEKILQKELAGDVAYDDTLRNLRNLRLSGFLYEHLDKHPETALKPEIYYWLSFCESRWEKGPQDSLPESYLRKCINEFPKSSIAPKCYAEYESLTVFGYTGSSGTHIPPEVSNELKSMREKIGVKK